jgi:RNA polymerase sigma factor (sigma-70 family)
MKLENSIDLSLQELREEFTTERIGNKIYSEVRAIVKFAIIGGGYPTMYSPMGKWDEEAYDILTSDFCVDKLLKKNYIAYLLQANTSIRTFRKNTEGVFKNFLISRKKKTALDHLFRRANKILQQDKRFKCFSVAKKKAHSSWGLSSWVTSQVFDGREEDIFQIGLELGGTKKIEYRPDAKKISHVVPDKELAEFMYNLFATVKSLLNLTQIADVFKYKYNLLDISEVSFEDPVLIDEDDNILTIGDTVGTPEAGFEAQEIDDAAAEALRLLTPRQKQVLKEFQEAEATLSSMGTRIGCSKSTIDNELRRISSIMERVSKDNEEARVIYNKIIAIIHDNEN